MLPLLCSTAIKHPYAIAQVVRVFTIPSATIPVGAGAAADVTARSAGHRNTPGGRNATSSSGAGYFQTVLTSAVLFYTTHRRARFLRRARRTAAPDGAGRSAGGAAGRSRAGVLGRLVRRVLQLQSWHVGRPPARASDVTRDTVFAHLLLCLQGEGSGNATQRPGAGRK